MQRSDERRRLPGEQRKRKVIQVEMQVAGVEEENEKDGKKMDVPEELLVFPED